MKVEIQYFAALREARGLSRETLDSRAATASALYEELASIHHFTLPLKHVRVAINNELADMDQVLREGDSVVFIPPVAGG